MDIRTYAIKHGGFPRIAEILGFNAEFLRQVAKGRRRVSAENAVRIELLTQGTVTRAELRPDIFHPRSPIQGDTSSQTPAAGRESA
ncbi:MULTISPECIES: transcriptional regulator [Acidithiobacillus]|jgi:DNA-binding transcriptional regulator YdaS (Cro superfamily)|uniref:Cro/Cl family transcriptional regulator n=1 Tax=Acidithiobacillus ferrooxidans TaxID=920 RepID=A0A2W1KFI1_ACIFR|nr:MULTISPECIES: YdaS family helix-turn-helix protein [Acidithiobacillus]MBU2731284.1 helix-turn-helix domain-containing protein [Acidithiobacillus ferridurans]MBU2774703.1 Cro/Cl family transcriptional regulator [Acidithiobacillus ferrooxidans]MBU2816443.1 helix-turn-helix domain-containing protein [Acidithiobacillus ferrooxidans]MCR0969786.1 helix-turn-helix domain-containing protein [Acidithiobacillus ferrooxidans]MCR1343551.1 helix-turn-helix domain-containing protein [Acidithiobacillus fe